MGALRYTLDVLTYPIELWKRTWLKLSLRHFHTENGENEVFMDRMMRSHMRRVEPSERERRLKRAYDLDRRYHNREMDIDNFVEETVEVLRSPPGYPANGSVLATD